MSSWMDAFAEPGEGEAAETAVDPSFVLHYPSLAQFLMGVDSAEKKFSIPPGSLVIWMEDGRIKCCFKVKARGMVGFKTLPGGQEGFKTIDALLESNQVEWRREGKRK